MKADPTGLKTTDIFFTDFSEVEKFSGLIKNKSLENVSYKIKIQDFSHCQKYLNLLISRPKET